MPKKTLHTLITSYRVFAITLGAALLAGGIAWVLFRYTEHLLTERLQERLVAIASTAATQFDSEDLNEIHTLEDMRSDTFEKIISQLQKIREANQSIQYAYIMRQTSDPDFVEFIADADSLTSEEELDTNGDGIIQDEELVPLPGELYSVSDYPVLRDEAFYHPSVDRELQADQWGLIMAAYAPIRNEEGHAVAIIGIDVLVDDFQKKTQETLLPFLLFILFLTLLLAFMTDLLIRFYSERVHVVQEIDRQKDELLSLVSHQLATPISSMKWYLENLQSGDLGTLSKEQKEHIQTMCSVAGGMTDIVQMILDVSRIQLKRMQINREDLDVAKLLHEILHIVDPKAKTKNIDLHIDMPEKLPTAFLDHRLTHMVYMNILNNAIKYTPENGSVHVRVSLQNGRLVFSVTDTGCGIPKKEQDRLFEKLFRASNVQGTEGNGFGLFIAKSAIEAQGGTIEFESIQEKGTTFLVTLPLSTPPQSSTR
ncbi:hypothetical protein A3D11_01765 [Candidatus Peribacteria bacterium RIFCSPHIGHO2_02_FULL_49_16]|nr:MAG: hypothetical protein A2880_00875 [Candidatus Peribacteria bacterium RIFCSPHIGHO2_01_FULL_49_38]OGJ58644.1 MAG: hypothetical protein A3D11_01765 [Candidatus Peribacteria bacterium RIFCSPHIGHO2_02_FULL_49_16]